MSSSDTGAGGDDDLSGVPWGGLNIQHMVARGHKSASQQGGSQQQSPQLYGSPSGGQQPYYDYDYDYDNTTPQYGSGGYAGASSSYGYGAGAGTGAGSVGSYDAGGAGTGAGGADDRYFDTSASYTSSSSSPSYFSYDAFSTGEDSGSSSNNSGARY